MPSFYIAEKSKENADTLRAAEKQENEAFAGLCDSINEHTKKQFKEAIKCQQKAIFAALTK